MQVFSRTIFTLIVSQLKQIVSSSGHGTLLYLFCKVLNTLLGAILTKMWGRVTSMPIEAGGSVRANPDGGRKSRDLERAGEGQPREGLSAKKASKALYSEKACMEAGYGRTLDAVYLKNRRRQYLKWTQEKQVSWNLRVDNLWLKPLLSEV